MSSFADAGGRGARVPIGRESRGPWILSPLSTPRLAVLKYSAARQCRLALAGELASSECGLLGHRDQLSHAAIYQPVCLAQLHERCGDSANQHSDCAQERYELLNRHGAVSSPRALAEKYQGDQPRLDQSMWAVPALWRAL